MTLKFYSGVAKGLKLKVRTFCELSHMFVEVTEEKLVGRPFCPPRSHLPFIPNRVKSDTSKVSKPTPVLELF